MEVDPEFEFECPKWVDFEMDTDETNIEDFEVCLDDSWFKREHPLHEPKDKAKNERELRPLIDVKELQNEAKQSRINTTKVTTKYKTSKKSLGIKQSVTLQRREKRRILPEITNNITKGDAKNDNANSNEDIKQHKDGFNSQMRYFTPPTTVYSPSRAEKDITPLSVLLHSPLRGNIASMTTINSPKRTLLAKAANNVDGQRKRRRLPTIPTESQDASAFLPSRAQSSSEGTNHSKSKTQTLDSSPLFDMKTLNSTTQHNKAKKKTNSENENIDGDLSVEDLLKLHNKKVMASKSKYDSNGRRIKTDNIMSSTIDSYSRSMKDKGAQNRSKLQEDDKISCVDELETSTETASMRSEIAENYKGQATLEEQSSITHKVNANVSTNETRFSETTSEVAAKSKTEKNPEELSIKNAPKSNENIEDDDLKGQPSGKGKEENGAMSIEELLKLHNKKVMASKCKYDSNGRRIQPANPVFCPAPTESESPKRTALKRTRSQRFLPKTTTSERRSSLSSSTDCKTKPKNPVRRSCVVAPTKQTSKKEKVSSNNHNKNPVETSTKTKNMQSSCDAASITGRRSHNESHKPSTSMKQPMSTADLRRSQTSKRRSCIAAPTTGRISEDESSMTSTSLKRTVTGTDLKSTQMNKRRSCMSTSTSGRISEDESSMTSSSLKCTTTGTDLKSAQMSKRRSCMSTSTTGRISEDESSMTSSSSKRTINKSDPKSTQRDKRRSCVAAPNTERPSVSRSSSTNASNPTTQKSKRRSCVAAPVSGKGMGPVGTKPVKQKRRSCFAAPRTPKRKPTKDDGEVDDELKDLIARHNQRLAMLK